EREPFFKNIRRSLTINPYIFVGTGIGLALQSLALYVVPEWFHAIPITLECWGYALIIPLICFMVVEVRKWIELLLKKLERK
ncbi:MAG: cation transporting ATPase C-terminal domain-containing protein, partial [Candidatus Nezhaarchaeales archaeon]